MYSKTMRRQTGKKDSVIAIIIPTYNEKENIKRLVQRIYKVLPRAIIVVVDDSPNDGTLKAIKQLSKKYSLLRIISRNKKQGRGSAVLAGFSYAKKHYDPDIFIEMDADLSHDPNELLGLIKRCEKKTVIIGSRYIKGSKIINWPVKRRVASKLSNLLVRVMLGVPLHDSTNGYRCYPREAINHLLSRKYISGGYIVLSEVAYLLMKKGYSFIEVPSVFFNRRRGTSNANLSEFFNALVTLLKLRLQG